MSLRMSLVLLIGAWTTGCATLAGLDDYGEAAPGGSAEVGGAGGDGGQGGVAGGEGGTGGLGGGVVGGGATACGTVSALGDQLFDGEELPPGWNLYAESGVQASLSDEVVFEASGTTTGFAQVNLQIPFFLRDDGAGVRVISFPDTGSSGYASMTLRTAASDYSINFRFEGDKLRFQRLQPSLAENSVTFDAAQHAYWRFREEEGTTYWETSADGRLYEEQFSIPSPADERPLYLELAFYAAADSTGSFAFDDFVTMKDRTWCPAADLVDDFEDGSLASKWSTYVQNGGSVDENAGAAVLALPGGGSSGADTRAVLRSATPHDLTSGSVAVEVEGLPAGTGSKFWFRVDRAAGPEFAEFSVDGAGTMTIISRDSEDSGVTQTVDYLPEQHRHLRLDQSAGDSFRWQTSADGLAWEDQASILNLGFPLDAVDVVLGVAALDSTTASVRLESLSP